MILDMYDVELLYEIHDLTVNDPILHSSLFDVQDEEHPVANVSPDYAVHIIDRIYNGNMNILL